MMKKSGRKILLLFGTVVLLCALMCIGAFAEGDAVRVESTGNTYDDLREAIIAAGSNDTVTLLKDFEIPEHSGIIYMDAGGTKKYKIKGVAADTTLTFGTYGDFWGNTDVTFENITVKISRTGSMAIGDTIKVTFGNGCTVTTDKTDTIGTVMQPQGTAVVTMTSGCTVKDMNFQTFASVCASSTFNVDGVKLDNVTVGGVFAVGYDTATVNVSALDASGATLASGATALIQKAGSSTVTFTGKVTTKSGTTPVKVLKGSATGTDTAELQAVTADATVWYQKSEVVEVEKEDTKTTYAGIYNALSSIAKYTDGYVITLNGDQTITGKINSQNPIAERRFTLDGKGHKLTMAQDSGTVWGGGNATFTNVTLAVKDQTFGNTSKVTLGDGCVLTAIDSDANYAIKVQDTAQLTMKSGSSVKNASFKNCIIQANAGSASSHPIIVTEAGVTTDNVTVTDGVTVNGNEYSNILSTLGAKAKAGNRYCLNFLGAVTGINGGTIELYDDIEFSGIVPGASSYTLEGKNHKLTVNSTYSFGGNAADNVHSTVKMKDLDIVFNVSGGSGMSLYSSYLTLENVKVTSLQDMPTAFYITDNSTVTAENSTFKNMTLATTDNTGVFKVMEGTLTLKDCEISGNTGALGGAVAVFGSSTLNLNGGAIKDNKAWSGAGVKVWNETSTVNIEGAAVVYGNKLRNDGNPASNIELNSCANLNVKNLTADGKVGIHKDTDSVKGKPNAIAEGTMIGSITGALKTAGAITSDADDTLVAYAKEGKLYMIKKPDLTVTTDSGVYAKGAKGVIRAMSTFTNTTDGTVIEACGTYFVKTAPTVGDSTKTSQWSIENVAASNGKGFQADLEAITDLEQSIVAVSWYKLSGVDEYIYVIGSAVTVDATNTVEYTEA